MPADPTQSPFIGYRDGVLHVEDVALPAVAQRFGTPCFVYSRAHLTRAFEAFDRPFGAQPHLICYAVKANSSLAILGLFARLGGGFDIVSGGELERVLAAGGEAGKVVFSGVGKRADEIELALAKGVLCLNVESESELVRISRIASQVPPHRAASACASTRTSIPGRTLTSPPD